MKQPDESFIGQCEDNTFKSHWDKLHNLLGMKLGTDVTLLPFPLADNDISVYFLCPKYGLWNYLDQRILVILVIELPVQLKWMSKK